MVKGRRKAEWARAGTIAATIFNANRAKGQSARSAEDYYRETSPEQLNAEFRDFIEKQQQKEP